MINFKKYMGLYFGIALFFCLYIFLLECRYNKAFENVQKEYLIKIVSIKEESRLKDKYVGKILKGNDKNIRVYLYTSKDKTYQYGDIVKVKGELEFPDKARNDKGFDYAKFLKTQKICASIFSSKVEFLKQEKSFFSKIYDLKNYCKQSLEDSYSNEKAEFLKALLLGDKSEISNETKEMFSKSNLSHILAISGLHVTYIVLYLEKFLEKIVNSIKKRNIIIVIFLIFFIIFTGASPSVIRASIMMIMHYLAKTILRENDFYIGFIVSLLIILLINPYNIYSISMWLSYMGTLGIVLFSRPLQKISIKKLKIKSKFLKKILEIIIVSISAQILIFPIMWKNFGTVSLNFWISNLLVSELVAPILIIGYISIIIIPIRGIIVFLENIILEVFLKIVLISSKIPFNEIFMPIPSNFTIFSYYAFILALVCFYKKHKITCLKYIINNEYLKFCKKALAILITICIFNQAINFIPGKLKINFLDVGQGDCTLIKTKYNKIILIDSGEGHSDKYDYGKNTVIPYLMSHGIGKIDYLVISHFDSDHCGGAFAVIENVKVKNIVIGIQAERYANSIEFLKIAQKKNIRVIVVKAKDKLKIDKETSIDVLFPSNDYTISENKINNNSLVMSLKYKDFSMLFTGDIEETAEKYLAKEYKEKLESKVIKIAHHGSKTSSTDAFLEFVKPQIALIGVGKNNSFGHPSHETLDRLYKLNCKIYRTDDKGEIQIKTDGKKISLKNKC